MKRFIAAILGICLWLFCISGLADTDGGYVDPHYTFRLFVEKLQAGHYDEALQLYHEDEDLLSSTASIPEFPTYAEYAEGLQFLQNGQLDDALAYFQRVRRIMIGNDENTAFPDYARLGVIIRDENKVASLEAAGLPDIMVLITYTQARIAQRDGRLEEAIAGYEQVRPFIRIRVFSDVLSRIGECDAMLIPTQIRYSAAGSSATMNSFRFSWNDIEDASGYIVSWKPIGAGIATTLETEETEILAEDLLPNTSYRVTVIAVDDTQSAPLIATITTERAKSLSGSIVREEQASLWTYEARRLDLYTIDEIRTDGWIHEPDRTEEGAYIIRVTPYYATGLNRYELHTVLRNTDSNRETVTYTLILRMPDELGIYSLKDTIAAPSVKYSRGMVFPFDLKDLLSQYFSGQDGMWVESAGTIELYIDGMYVDAVPVTFELD